MTDKSNDETVDRSRLKLLGVLAAAGASGACSAPSSPDTDTLLQRQRVESDPLARLTSSLTRTSQTEKQRLEEKARQDSKKAALARKKAEYARKRERALDRINKYGDKKKVYIPEAEEMADDYYTLRPDPLGGEGESGGGSH